MKKVLIAMGLIAIMSTSVFAYGLEINGLLGGPNVANSAGIIIPIDENIDIVAGIGFMNDNWKDRNITFGTPEIGGYTELILKGLFKLSQDGPVSTHAGLSFVSVRDNDAATRSINGGFVQNATIITGLYGADVKIAEGVSVIIDMEILVLTSGTDAFGNTFSQTTLIGNPSIGVKVDLPW